MTEKCDCGKELEFYEGALGYEAFVCRKCGFFSDVLGEEGHDKVYVR